MRHPIRTLAFSTAIVVGALIGIGSLPQDPTRIPDGRIDDTAVAQEFWRTDASTAVARRYAAEHEELVTYKGSVKAPATANIAGLMNSSEPDMGVYDAAHGEWHIFLLSAHA